MEISCDEKGFELRPFGRTDQTARTVVEINEEDAGWEPFIQAVATNLPGSVARDTWWTGVAQTQVATNQAIVYRKEQQLG